MGAPLQVERGEREADESLFMAITARACRREQSLKFTLPAVEILERDLIKVPMVFLSLRNQPSQLQRLHQRRNTGPAF